MKEIEDFKVTLVTSFAIFEDDCEIDNTQRKEWNTDSPLIENRVPKRIFREGDNVTVKNYKIDLNATSKISVLVESKEDSFWVEAEKVFGPEIGRELNSIITGYMGWLFGNSQVIAEILNHTEGEHSIWRESNVTLHTQLKKVLKVRHISKKFGI